MKTPFRSLLALAVLPLLVSACGGGQTAWTFSPPVATSPAAEPSASEPAGPSPASPLPSGPSMTSPPASPGGSPGSSPGGSPGTSPSGDVIDLVMTATLQFQQNGQPVTNLTVPAGRPITFRVDNQAGLDHNFNIGEPEKLAAGDTSGATGIETWQSGIREVQFTFETGQNLEFACVVPGHYQSMHGSFTIQ